MLKPPVSVAPDHRIKVWGFRVRGFTGLGFGGFGFRVWGFRFGGLGAWGLSLGVGGFRLLWFGCN